MLIISGKIIRVGLDPQDIANVISYIYNRVDIAPQQNKMLKITTYSVY
ncbi:MAG: hypothetical protein KFW21_01285 [Spirochaetota bacterium]|nr:hypothetical protein [Spirochaetota bacterium]